MTHFADLTPYTFIRSSSGKNELNVGWLGRWRKFQTGSVPDEVLAGVFMLCQRPVNKTRGLHICEFCPGTQSGVLVERDGIELWLGSAEIRVPGPMGVEYACPDLIYHYIKDHEYKPPQEFIEAILKLTG